MKVFNKILKWLLVVLFCVIAFIVIMGFLFRYHWDSYSVNSLDEARELIKKHSSAEHQLVVRECNKLITRGIDVTYLKEEIPDGFKVISPQYIRASNYNCEVNLYKIPGKGIAYWVTKDKDGQLKLSWRDDFISWQPNKIELK